MEGKKVKMDGYVDRSTLTPMVRLKLISAMEEEIELSAIIDTGYNGEVILSENKIQEMGLEFLGTIDTELADGRIVELDLFRGRIKWFGRIQEVAVGASRSDDTLLGTLLLADCELDINFKDGWAKIEQLVSKT
jgi:clan AA aspartic protease